MCQISPAAKAKDGDQNPSLNKICHGDSQQRSPNAPKFEDRSQEETEWQEHWCPRSSVEAGTDSVLKLKEHDIQLAFLLT